MHEPDLILFDDRIARLWQPFALTRPLGELLFGALTLRERAERVTGSRCIGHLTAPHLQGFDEAGAAPVLSEPPPTRRPRLFLCSRFVPDWGAEVNFRDGRAGPICGVDGKAIGWFAPPGEPGPKDDFVLDPTAAGSSAYRPELPGKLLERAWNLISLNPDQITRDIRALFPKAPNAELPAGSYQWGEHPLIVDSSATVEPAAVFDTSLGPIWLDRHTHVRAFTRLAGPAYVGPGSVLLGGAIEAVTVGPVCRIRGELAESVCLGYVNKQHDGHMGHAYLGRWVNLGAETTNSDLKNNYGNIRMWTPEGEVDTGEMKMGSLIGDHVKTGIGLLLNTGTTIGAGSNLYGSAMPPTFVPPFSWGTGSELVEYRLDKFLEVAERAMSRRSVTLSATARTQLSEAWKVSQADRNRAQAPR
jgi:UDP-N-acetylglucosamine diphosphorylase / glucose-1-phosphate thymidylyltransferase / UDP-N-acetylgalactosamine diphosphorylase / glucosamine-1-phosphate N-acetyltransferase / galactosamine-1-phosphate N-acetyltransferase